MQPNHNKELIGHFLIIFGFFFKASPGAHTFVWKLVFTHMQLKTNFHNYASMSTRTRFVKEATGNSEIWPIAWDWWMLLEYLKLGKTAINIM